MYKICHFFTVHRSPLPSAFAPSRRLSFSRHGSIQRSTLVLSNVRIASSNLRAYATFTRRRKRAYSSARAVLAHEQTSNEHGDPTDTGQASENYVPYPDIHASKEKGSLIGVQTLNTRDDLKVEDTTIQQGVDTSNLVAGPYGQDPTFQGFWSLQKYHESFAPPIDDTTVPQPSDPPTLSAGVKSPLLVNFKPHQNNNTNTDFSELWTTSTRFGKIDLSEWNTLKGESNDVFPENTTYRPSMFRGSKSNPDRNMTKLFMQQFYNETLTREGISHEQGQQLLRSLDEIYGHRDLQHATDSLAWSWVLLAFPTLSIQRLIALFERRESLNLKPIPLWVVLQILRVQTIDGVSVRRITTFLDESVAMWDWLGDSPMLLVVRLLRHARLTAASCMEPVTALFLKLLDIRFADQDELYLRRLTLWCNRVLTLLSLPCAISPFRSMKHQQSSQLLIVQYMQDHRPQIPITREGYRAIAKLQLMHAKTDNEREWARAKALTWPPWEKRHQMGATSEPRIYPGKSSRVIKVLERMKEAGYAPYGFDLAVQVLAGWDTDRSPTIQTTRKSSTIKIATPWKPQSSGELGATWSARIEATRTVREAWMCFCSYTTAVATSRHSQDVYNAMFAKLLAKENLQISEGGPLPGDGKETYPDPELARDRVYIPEAIPSVGELFSKMVTNAMLPSARLLSTLLWHEKDLQQGLKYMSAARLRAKSKQVLAAPEIQFVALMAEIIKQLPDSLCRAYIRLLSRPHALKTARKPVFGHQRTSGAVFAKAILISARIRDISMWNQYFAAVSLHSHGSTTSFHRLHVSEAWDIACDGLVRLWARVPVNFATFQPVAQLAFTALTALDMPATKFDPVETTKRLFNKAASGSSTIEDQPGIFKVEKKSAALHSVPSGDAIELMVWVLGAAHSSDVLEEISAMLYWVHAHKDTMLASGQRLTRHNLAVFRVFFEGMWATEEPGFQGDVRTLAPDKYTEIQKLVKDIGPWPDDNYMKIYLAMNTSKIKRVQTALYRRSIASTQ